MELKKIADTNTFELAVRIFTAFYVAIYGLAKPLQFSGEASIYENMSLSELSGMQLMWAFFGYTLTYPIIIGIMQLTAAIMLLFERTKLIAALLLTPIFLNIILLDILYEVNKGALLNAIVFQLIFIFIIVQQRKKLITVFSNLMLDKVEFNTKKERVFKFILASILGVILFFSYQYVI